MAQAWVAADVTAVSARPCSRFGQAIVADDARQSIIIQGGRDEKTSAVFADAFALSYAGVKPVWTRLFAETALPARYNHSICVVRGVLCLFGGLDESHSATDALFTMRLDTMLVTRAATLGDDHPCARSEHAMIEVDGVLLLFGGKDADGAALDDLWALEPTEDQSLRWRRVATSGPTPSARWNPLLWRVPGARSRVCVFGGCGAEGLVTEMYSLELASWTWSLVVQTGDVPPPTQRYHGVLVPDRDMAIVMGEKGPLRMYLVRDWALVAGGRVKWGTYKSSGALPAQAGFALAVSPDALVLTGGKPSSAKDGSLQVWMLDTGALSASLSQAGPVAVAAAQPSSGGMPANKYGTLRALFGRKTSSSASTASASAPAPGSPSSSSSSIANASSPSRPSGGSKLSRASNSGSLASPSTSSASSPKHTRKHSDASRVDSVESSPSVARRIVSSALRDSSDTTPPAVPPRRAPPVSSMPESLDGSSLSLSSGLASPTSSSAAAPASEGPRSPKRSTFRRATSSSRLDQDSITHATAASVPEESGLPSPTRGGGSPAGSPREEAAQLRKMLAAALASRQQAVQDLENERKRSAALRAEMERSTGQTDSSLLVRHALDDEIKRGAQLSQRIEALEREVADAATEKAAFIANTNKLKRVIARQSEAQISSDAAVLKLEEQLAEAREGLVRLNEVTEQRKQLASALQVERVERLVCEQRAAEASHALAHLSEVLTAWRHEYQQPQPDAARMALVDEAVVAQHALILKDAGGRGKDETDAMDDDGSESGSSPPGGSPRLSSPASLRSSATGSRVSPRSAAMGARGRASSIDQSPAPIPPAASGTAPQLQVSSTTQSATSRHAALLRELEYLNECNQFASSAAAPHPLSEVCRVLATRFVERLQRDAPRPSDLEELEWIVGHLISAETRYVQQLSVLCESFRAPMLADGVSAHVEAIFGPLPALLEAHSQLLATLQGLREDKMALLSCYASTVKERLLDCYDAYADGFASVLHHLDLALVQSGRFRRFIRARTHLLPLMAFDLRAALVAPFAQVAIYCELFARIASLASENEEPKSAAVQAQESPAAVPDDLLGAASLGRALCRLLQGPHDSYREALDTACSSARLMVLESLLALYADDQPSLVTEGRVHLDEATLVVAEESADDEDAREANTLLVVACNDSLLMVQGVRGTPHAPAAMRLHELIPMHLLQLPPSPQLMVDGLITLFNKAKPALVYSLRMGSVARALRWEELLKNTARAASQLVLGRTKSLADSMHTSSSSGWMSDVRAPEASVSPSRGSRRLEDVPGVICYIADAQSGGNLTVRGAVPAALVRWLIRDISGPHATEEVLQFLQACNRHLSAVIVLDTALQEFHGAGSDLLHAISVLNFLGLWVADFCLRDLLQPEGPAKSPLFRRLLDFALEVPVAHPQLAPHVSRLKLGLLRGVAEWRRIVNPPVAAQVQDEGPINLDDVPPTEVAEQLTALVHSLFAAIRDDDFWVGDTAPTIAAMIKQWNTLSAWCLGYLNSGAGQESTSLAHARRMLLIAKRCLELNNYDSAFAMGLALDQARIRKPVREALGRGVAETWDTLEHITNVSRGFANYRALMDALTPPAIPYLAMSLKDILLIRENDTYIEKSEMLNYRKLVILGSRLRFLRRFRAAPYAGITPNVAVQEALRTPKSYPKLERSGTPVSSLNLADMSPQSSSGSNSPVSGGSLASSRTMSVKLQKIKKSVATTAEALKLYSTPRSDGAQSSGSSLTARENRAKEREAQRPFTARVKRAWSPRSAADAKKDMVDQQPSPQTQSPQQERTVPPELPPKTPSASVSTPEPSTWARAAPAEEALGSSAGRLTLRRGSVLLAANGARDRSGSQSSATRGDTASDVEEESTSAGDERVLEGSAPHLSQLSPRSHQLVRFVQEPLEDPEVVIGGISYSDDE